MWLDSSLNTVLNFFSHVMKSCSCFILKAVRVGKSFSLSYKLARTPNQIAQITNVVGVVFIIACARRFYGCFKIVFTTSARSSMKILVDVFKPILRWAMFFARRFVLIPFFGVRSFISIFHYSISCISGIENIKTYVNINCRKA